MDDRKQKLLAALVAYARQRPGFDWHNYGDAVSYNREVREATRALAIVRTLARACDWRGITAEDLLDSARGGRVTIVERNGLISVDYCAGQYFPTEFRPAIARVLAGALWAYVRERCMPRPSAWIVERDHGLGIRRIEVCTFDTEEKARAFANNTRAYVSAVYRRGNRNVSAGDWLRGHFRDEFGRGIASRFFN